MSSTSYPRTDTDWQGVFIRNLCDALAERPDIELSLWSPEGPRHELLTSTVSPKDACFLNRLSQKGGIASHLKNRPFGGALSAASLLSRLRADYLRAEADTDIFHINWLQNALPLYGTQTPAVIAVLGTDFKLLRLPGMRRLLSAVFRQRRCILAPNSEWMVAPLREMFGDCCGIFPVPFGIGSRWFDVERKPSTEPCIWLTVLRVTREKIGPLFKWGELIFTSGRHQLHLIGPNQDDLEIPEWVHFHGPASPDELAAKWFPKATAMISLSEHSEGKPQVMLEALAAGLPIIASGIEAHASFLDQEVHGVLVNDEAAFLSAIERIADTPAAFSAHCREAARQEYGTWSDCAARYQTLYRKLL